MYYFFEAKLINLRWNRRLFCVLSHDMYFTIHRWNSYYQQFDKLGMWSDRITLRYGRRKILILAGVIAISLSFFFLWHKCIRCSGLAPKYQAIYFAFFGIVFLIGWAAIGLPQL